MDDFRLVFAYYSPMGGERGSTTRMRESGRICRSCKVTLDSPPARARERYCDRCGTKRSSRRVYLRFFAYKDAWTVQFSKVTLDRALDLVRTFRDEQAIRNLIDRTPTKIDSAAKNALEYAFEKGRGGIHLDLTAAQYESPQR